MREEQICDQPVDVSIQIHYLMQPMMRRHLITLFALFSGLAALHAPANASSLESMVFDVRALARANDASSPESCVCEQRKQDAAKACPPRKSDSPLPRVLRRIRPAIIFGSERALE